MYNNLVTERLSGFSAFIQDYRMKRIVQFALLAAAVLLTIHHIRSLYYPNTFIGFHFR